MITQCPECKGVPNCQTLFEYGHHVQVQKCPYCRGVGYCEIKPATREMMCSIGKKDEADFVFGKQNES